MDCISFKENNMDIGEKASIIASMLEQTIFVNLKTINFSLLFY